MSDEHPVVYPRHQPALATPQRHCAGRVFTTLAVIVVLAAIRTTGQATTTITCSVAIDDKTVKSATEETESNGEASCSIAVE